MAVGAAAATATTAKEPPTVSLLHHTLASIAGRTGLPPTDSLTHSQTYTGALFFPDGACGNFGAQAETAKAKAKAKAAASFNASL